LCREEWVGRVPSYQLRFMDGYEPERIYWDDNDVISDTYSRTGAQTPQRARVCQLSE